MGQLFHYSQVRYMYEFGKFWEPVLPPDAAAMWQRERLGQMHSAV
jgi:hypothetical protein